jgi:hypothetical protein
VKTALRIVRAATAAAIVVALVDQFFFGRDLPTFRAVNFFSYFTVLSNIFAAVLLAVLAARPDLIADRTVSVVRGAVTLYMAVTGIVYNVLLAPVAADVSTNLDWYPYPFLDPDLESVGSIVVTCAAIFVTFVALSAVLRLWAGRGRVPTIPDETRADSS